MSHSYLYFLQFKEISADVKIANGNSWVILGERVLRTTSGTPLGQVAVGDECSVRLRSRQSRLTGGVLDHTVSNDQL